MRWLVATLLVAIATFVIARAGRVAAYESFTLEQHDKILVEAPGCYAECRIQGSRRVCMLKNLDCKVVCQSIPECSQVGQRPLKVCATVRTGP